MITFAFLAILVFFAVGWIAGKMRARAAIAASDAKAHSRPNYHAGSVALWAGLPSFVLLLLWSFFQGTVQDAMVISALPASMTDGITDAQRSLLLSEIRQVATGNLFRQPSPEIAAAAERFNSLRVTMDWLRLGLIVVVSMAGMIFALSRISARYRARYSVEATLSGLMIFSALIAVLTTIGIVLSLVFETAQFFALVPPMEFLFGTRWEPQIAMRADQIAGTGAFGVIPVMVGTMVIAVIAMAVAVPIGLFGAIYLAEYADNRLRDVIKPALEILAGVPSIVYGFFALLIVAPLFRDIGGSAGLDVAARSALAAGSVMGIMIVPYILSLTDDALTAVPRAMRDGAYALGATKGETIRGVLLTAALPGIVGGVLLALSKAIGETMVVVMAAGLIATLNINPLESVTTVTVQIVAMLTGDTAFDNPKTLSAFALGLLLFVITLGLNVIALGFVKKYQEKY